jgi:hypothetical protein
MKNRIRIGVLLATVLMLAGPSVATAAESIQPTAPSTATKSDDKGTDKLTKEKKDLLKSNKPKTIVTDVVTAEVLSVTEGFTEPLVPRIVQYSYCSAGQACYYANQTPYANYGFQGTPGTISGSWPARAGYTSGNYTVRGCTTFTCYQTVGPNSNVVFSGGTATGTSFTIY